MEWLVSELHIPHSVPCSQVLACKAFHVLFHKLHLDLSSPPSLHWFYCSVCHVSQIALTHPQVCLYVGFPSLLILNPFCLLQFKWWLHSPLFPQVTRWDFYVSPILQYCPHDVAGFLTSAQDLAHTSALNLCYMASFFNRFHGHWCFCVYVFNNPQRSAERWRRIDNTI